MAGGNIRFRASVGRPPPVQPVFARRPFVHRPVRVSAPGPVFVPGPTIVSSSDIGHDESSNNNLLRVASAVFLVASVLSVALFLFDFCIIFACLAVGCFALDFIVRKTTKVEKSTTEKSQHNIERAPEKQERRSSDSPSENVSSVDAEKVLTPREVEKS